MPRSNLLGALALTAVLSLSANASILHPGLDAELNTRSIDDPISVIAFLEEAPVAQISADLSSADATRQERNRTIVEALQTQQEVTQAPLKIWLDEAMREGSVFGYTSYWITNCVVVHATKQAVLDMAQLPEIERLEPNWKAELIEPVDRPMPNGDELGNGPTRNRGGGLVTPGVRACRADEVWYDFGITGAGRIVANMDTGVDGNHPAYASRWRGTTHPASESWIDVLGGSPNFPTDGHGHGTHVMGTITGNSPTTMDTVGVAWGSVWIASNAINQGVGGEFDNDVITSFQFFMNPDGDSQTFDDVPDVVQNSWRINEGFGGGYQDCDTRWWNAMDNCEAAGVVVTFSAGNEGPGSGTIGSPPDRATTALNAFSIGAIDATNSNWPYPIASFSSRGPSGCDVSQELKIKPEVVAPGVDVYSSVPGGSYQGGWNGTSMSGPHVAGIVALMREADPNLEVDEIKQILIDTARDLGTTGNDNTYGWGMVDAYAAVEQALVDFGRLEGFVGNASFGDAPIVGATVRVLEEDRTFVSDSDGNYSGLVPPGIFTVEATHPSFDTQQFQVTVNPGLTTQRDFSLNDIAGPTIENVTNPLSTSDTAGPYVINADIEDASSVANAQLFYRVDGGAWVSTAMTTLAGFSGAIPGQSAGTTIDFYVWAEDGVGLQATDPINAPIGVYTMKVTEIAYLYDAETQDDDWTLGVVGDQAETGIWERANPNGTESDGTPMQMEDDNTPDPGVNCFVTGNSPAGSGAGENDVDNGCTTLVSPVFDLSVAEEAFVSYARWFQMGGASTDDVFAIEVSNNGGGSWQELETVTTFDANWHEVTLELTDFGLTNQMQIRFIACDVNVQGLTECGVDDFSIEIFAPNPANVEDGPIALRSKLEVNAPNPMQGVTTMRFRLSNASDARLTVYDASGRHVRTLVDGPMAAGSHAVQWDGRDDSGRDVGAGVYFYNLVAGSFEQSRRLQLLK